MPEGYCVKCREKGREMVDAKEEIKQGKSGEMIFLMGKCKVCGTKMSKIVGKKK